MHGNAHNDSATVWLLTGQGAQYYQMGRRLYDANPTFRTWMDRLDEAAADFTGHSIVGMMYDDARAASEPFEMLTDTHPALFMVQYAMARTLLAEGFAPPDVLLGASLGEFVAAAVAGVVDPATMLFDLIRQAYLSDGHCPGGAMLMVIDDVERFEADAVYAGCELAGVNFARCVVIAGPRARIAAVAEQLGQREIGCQLLPVPVAFHSSAVDAVRVHYEQAWSGRAFAPGTVPIVSCGVVRDGGCRAFHGGARLGRHPRADPVRRRAGHVGADSPACRLSRHRARRQSRHVRALSAAAAGA